MSKYIVTLFLRDLDENFWGLMPNHREMIDDLMVHEMIETYAINLQKTRGWIVFNASAKEEVAEYIESMPVRDYFSYKIEQLIVFDNAPMQWPKMIMN